jgi:hypothetical protein
VIERLGTFLRRVVVIIKSIVWKYNLAALFRRILQQFSVKQQGPEIHGWQ